MSRIIIPGESEPQQKSVFSRLFAEELTGVLENTLRLEAWRRVRELRESAGIKPQEKLSINVNLPPRYRA